MQLSWSRKWSGLTWLSVASLTCIVTACIITMAGVAVSLSVLAALCLQIAAFHHLHLGLFRLLSYPCRSLVH